ncbi:MAG: SgcJ/EcaC family oxidoreductase [Planctomycetota bacterium]
MDIEKEILNLFTKWNVALKTGKPSNVVSLYAETAVLLPTASNQVRDTPALIEDYFKHFLERGPSGRIDQSHVRMFGGIAINSGVYTFRFSSGESMQARYTFVYQSLDGQWLIVEHHSSAMPEGQTA